MSTTPTGTLINADCSGKVKFFKGDKGFGFILDNDSGKDVFVHISGLADQGQTLRKDDEVSFDIEQGKKGPCAVNVKRI